jgi:hypothetical protein
MRSTTVFLVLLMTLTPAIADEGIFGEAERLCDESGADWRAGRYAEGAEKLRRAEALYRKLGADCEKRLVVVLRRLCWNEAKAGDGDAALSAYGRLLDKTTGKPQYLSEGDSGHDALYFEVAKPLSLKEALGYLGRMREVALGRDCARGATMCLHSMAYLAMDRGKPDLGERHFARVITEWTEQKDVFQVARAHRDLAWFLKDKGRFYDSLSHYLATYHAVQLEGVKAFQSWLAFELYGLLNLMDDSEAELDFLRRAGEIGAKSDLPEIVPCERILRVRLKQDRSFEAAEQVFALKLVDKPAEVKADLVLRAAENAARAGKPAAAAKWIEGLDLGRGPAVPHLETRLAQTRAIIAARQGNTEEFVARARAAAAAWRELGDRSGTSVALRELAEEIQRLDLSKQCADILDEQRNFRSKHPAPPRLENRIKPGGDPAAVKDLAAETPVFSVCVDGEELVLSDLLSKVELRVPISWQPRNVAFCGMRATVFGGYILIGKLAYGADVSLGESAGPLPLDMLDILSPYRPVPAGRLLILKNGAERYE